MARSRKPSGRPLPADGSGDPTVIPVVPAVDTGEGGVEWGVRTVSAGFALDLDAAILVDRMSAALLRHTRESILAGQRPDGGGPQDELSARALANPDRQSPHRGYASGTLADELYRTPIESTGREASCRVLPPRSRNPYVGRERKNGRELLTLRGAAGAVVEAAAREAVAEMLTGREVDKSRGELAAKDVDKK